MTLTASSKTTPGRRLISPALTTAAGLLFLTAAFFITHYARAQSEGDVVDRVIAVVGDEIILESEVFQNAQAIALQQGLSDYQDPEKFTQLKREVLQEMINQKVLLAKAREDSIEVEKRNVDRELENRLQTIIQNVGSEEKLEELYGYSIRRIRREFRPTVEEGLLVEKVKQKYLQNVRVTRSEIERYFKEHPDEFPPMRDAVELAHILRETSSAGLADARALAKADSLYNLIKSGTPFDSLAAKFSQDKATAKKFGYVGWTQRGDLLQEYENTAFALQPGEISKPIKTRYGYHIIRLNERRDDEINTSHILITPQIVEADEKPVIEFLEKLRQEILAGKPFEEAAREYSQDLESAKKGGYLGWFSLEEMPESFRSEIEPLKVGEISKPFKTEYGYHIVKLLNRRDARPVTLQQDWEMIAQYVLNKKKEKAYNDWLKQLKQRYYIEIKT